MEYTGAGMLIEALKRENVDTVFAYPGGAVIPVFDVLYSEESIRVVLTRHEQAAVHAADAYARTTGKTGVCIVTSGPGATNTVTGLATANFDSVPLVCITGQVPRSMIGNDAFQEADTVGITRPVTKHNYIVTERGRLARTLKEAFHIASTGRPGPVVVDVPKDIMLQKMNEAYPDEVSIRGYSAPGKGHKGQIRKAAAELEKADRPLFFAGGGINIGGAAGIFRKLVEKTGVPVVTSLMGTGSFPTSSVFNLGMIGMHGTYTANMAVSSCDLLFGIGVRFDDRATMLLEKFAPHARIIHLDIDPSTIARNVPVEIPIVGDAAQVLEELYEAAEKKNRASWLGLISSWKKEAAHTNAYEGSGDVPGPSGLLQPGEVIRTVNRYFPEAIITTEVGQNQMWTALHWDFRDSRTFVSSGGLGTMGYGFPAAIGAAIGNPGKRVVAMAGDGSFQMNIQELATAVQNRLPVVIVILDNGYLGMVRQWQQMFNGGRYSSTQIAEKITESGCCSTPDFVKLAEAYGAEGFRVSTPEDLENALESAAAQTGIPVIIDCIIEPEANVWPMVPPGAGLMDMVFGTEKPDGGKK